MNNNFQAKQILIIHMDSTICKTLCHSK